MSTPTSPGPSSSKKGKQKEVKLTFGNLTEKNWKQVQILNKACLPVNYGERFYQNIIPTPELTQLVYFNDVIVGAVCCRLERSESEGNAKGLRLYIMTLGVLEPYRRLGIGAKLLEFVSNLAKDNTNVNDIYLHVQVTNEAAIAFYKKIGFEEIGMERGYYRDVTPPDCYILSKKIVRS